MYFLRLLLLSLIMMMGASAGRKFLAASKFLSIFSIQEKWQFSLNRAAAAAAANNNDIAYCESLNVICRFSRAEAAQKVVESSS